MKMKKKLRPAETILRMGLRKKIKENDGWVILTKIIW
jgi:hypothetical protein